MGRSSDEIEVFRKIFDKSDIVKRWKEKGYDHVGTIFVGKEYTISFPMDGGFTIENKANPKNRVNKFDTDMLYLIYETKKFILGLAKIVKEYKIHEKSAK